MNADGDIERLLTLARAIATGDAIQWDDERGLAEPELLAALQGLHRIAGANRTIQESPPPGFSRWAHLTIVERRRTARSITQCRARDALGRDVSLLLLGPLHGDPSEVELLLKQARLRTSVHHPSLAAVHGADYAQDHVGLWSEDLPGPAIEDVVRSKGPVDGEEAARILRDLCGAAGALHHAGLVHGDIRPGTVFRLDNRIVLAPSISTAADPAADLAGLGATLRYLLMGAEHALANERRKTLHGIPRALVRVADRAASTSAGDRFTTAAELESAVQRAQRPRWAGREWLIGFIAATLLAGAIVWLTLS